MSQVVDVVGAKAAPVPVACDDDGGLQVFSRIWMSHETQRFGLASTVVWAVFASVECMESGRSIAGEPALRKR
ncbi:hypothetical protein C8E89_114123 [Mycolicibacterium moriokaense]|uniref:Uncharacterized protein n=1 Tax=Mycolicibacterium moriokaense TaxID=39691 RepID=A0A318HDB8_9MYCO|nr:hypothetical protein C8E89_114123 [Mycolicibacterium moriokaense]